MEALINDQSKKPTHFPWIIIVAVILVVLLVSVAVPQVRASLSSWLGLSVAPASQVPVKAVTLEALIPSPSAVSAQSATEQLTVLPAGTDTAGSITSTLLLPEVVSSGQADLSQFSSQVGWSIPTPTSLPDGYQFQSAYFDPNQKMLFLTYLVTRPLPSTNDPSLTSSETITLLQSQRNDIVPMQIAPNTNITDTLVNGAPAAFTLGGWDTEFVKDNQSPGGGKMVSSWRNDLPVKNLYWQIGSLYLALITADEAVSQQELIDMADSIGK
jgi:hypothetical protein